MNTFDTQINKNSLVSVQEVGLKELLQEASKYYDENNLQIAVEKLWDAFERLARFNALLSTTASGKVRRFRI